MTCKDQSQRLRKAVGIALLSLAALLMMAGSASAAVEWEVNAQWGDTVLRPGGTGEFMLRVKNVGTTDASGAVTLKEHLPPGVTMTGFATRGLAWQCFGTQTVTCATNLLDSLGNPTGTAMSTTMETSHYLPQLFIEVAASPDASGTKLNTVTVSGGGGAVASTSMPVSFGDQPTDYGILPHSFSPADVYDTRSPGLGRERQAATHPEELRVRFDMNLVHDFNIKGESFTEPAGRLRTAEVSLPRGLVGNPEALPKCATSDFLQEGLSPFTATGCPSNTQVGYIDLELNLSATEHGYGIFSGAGNAFSRIAIYNLVAPKGTPVDLGFRAGGFVYGHIYAQLDPTRDYAIKSISPDISTGAPVRGARVTIWGVPGDPAHDLYRAVPPVNFTPGGAAIHDRDPYGAAFTNAPVRPFLTMPSDCGTDNGPFLMRADSWAAKGEFTPLLEGEERVNVEGCDDPRIRFEPEVSIQPTTRDASQPTGLDIHLETPQRDQTIGGPEQAGKLYDQSGNLHAIDTPPIKKVVVRMPEGMTLSASAAQGLTACSAAQMGIGNNDPVTCPDASQYGTLTLHTPVLPPDEPMKGFIYIAKQKENPFNDFLAMYFVIEDSERGLRIKIPGRVQLDPVTGQITTTFDDLPQFPLSDVQLTFKSGVRAALVNPATCGKKTISATFYSWAEPDNPIPSDTDYSVTQKADGSPCFNNLAERPFKAQMSAGMVNPNAASYSPFVFRMTRSDDDQELSQIGVSMPAGLTSKLAGITRCSEEAIAAASNPLRTGTEEASFPSCPASSQVGTTEVGSGVGVPLTFVPGKVYLGGPYKGAPLSLVVITPILAGPYDLGVIAVRSAISLDPKTTAVSVLTDPFPQIFQGIPVRLRDIRVRIDRKDMMRNPTNCDVKQIHAHLTGAGGEVNTTADDTAADLYERFQVANCAALRFKPKLSFRLKGGTKRNDHPAFTATLTAKDGEANIARAAVTLPHSVFLDQSHIRTVCTRVQYAADQCPQGAVYGRVRAWTPLLDETLEGPVYMRSSSHQLPDVVATLNGILDVELVGRIDSVKGSLRTTFDFVPDQPVSRFVLSMPGGGKGLLVNSTNTCKSTNRVKVLLDGQNGKTADQFPKLRNGCAKETRRAKARGARRAERKSGRTGR